MGDALPYPDGHFATVVSNSVLEHIPDVDAVLAEIARMLQRGGRFIFCVPGDQFTGLLFFPQLFRTLRLEGLALAYERYFNRISRHRHCDGPEVWRARLVGAGLELVDAFTYFSARANHALDLGHYLGAPSLVTKKLFGRWILVPRRWNLALTERWLRPLYEEPRPEVGAYLFFVASKP
jgi:SAM-dependent methyltransferase